MFGCRVVLGLDWEMCHNLWIMFDNPCHKSCVHFRHNFEVFGQNIVCGLCDSQDIFKFDLKKVNAVKM